MRHFGGKYSPGEKNDCLPGCEGFDQIKWLVEEIKTNYTSRRLVVSLWNPNDILISRLAPCHYCFHVDIDDEKRLSISLTQRSADYPVGICANIQFYSALCYMLSQQTGCKPYKLIHHTEDSHIYVNQIKQVEDYLSRDPVESPILNLKHAKDIFSYAVDDFEVINYNPHPPIKIPVAV
jgi:thymidylate synthase